jgi:DNA ligase D
MAAAAKGEERDGVKLTSLDEPLFPDAGVTKRQFVDYIDAVSELILPVLRDRPLSVIRTTGGQRPFMQKNVPKYTPEWVRTVDIWAEASQRTVSYALCNDRRTLLWFANQRAVEYHPTLGLSPHLHHATDIVLDLDPPEGAAFDVVVATARLVQAALDGLGLEGVPKTSGAKGVHIFVPVDTTHDPSDVAAATRAIAARAEALDPEVATTAYIKADRGGKVFVDSTRAGGATVAAAYSPRARPGAPVSFPLRWDELDDVAPSDFTVLTAVELLEGRASWTEALPPPQRLSDELIAEGHEIPVARVAAMHEGRRRKRAADSADGK